MSDNVNRYRRAYGASAFIDAVAGFYDVAEDPKWRRVGSSDTEPRSVFADLLVAVGNGQSPSIPTDASGWQLFSDMEGSNEAAAALCRAAGIAVVVGAADPNRLRRFLNDQGWC